MIVAMSLLVLYVYVCLLCELNGYDISVLYNFIYFVMIRSKFCLVIPQVSLHQIEMLEPCSLPD